MNYNITVVEVPTEAGTHFAGQTLAPRAIRQAGLQKKLKTVGYSVETVSALPHGPAPWKPTAVVNGVHNEAGALEVMDSLFKTISSVLAGTDPHTRPVPLVIGGDCSIVPAVMASLAHALDGKRLGILYMDGDADLTLPGETSEPGSRGLETMKKFSGPGGSPVVHKDNIVLFGFDPLQPTPNHFAYLLDNHFRCLTRPAVRADALGAAKEALQWLEDHVDAILIHFDVDVIDSGEFPLGNYPHYAGVKVDDAMTALKHFICSEKLVGMTLTEINPNNDPDGNMVGQVVEGVVAAFSARFKAFGPNPS